MGARSAATMFGLIVRTLWFLIRENVWSMDPRHPCKDGRRFREDIGSEPDTAGHEEQLEEYLDWQLYRSLRSDQALTILPTVLLVLHLSLLGAVLSPVAGTRAIAFVLLAAMCIGLYALTRYGCKIAREMDRAEGRRMRDEGLRVIAERHGLEFSELRAIVSNVPDDSRLMGVSL